MSSLPFLVASELVNLAVTVQDGAVTRIELHGQAVRPPETPFERMDLTRRLLAMEARNQAHRQLLNY